MKEEHKKFSNSVNYASMLPDDAISCDEKNGLIQIITGSEMEAKYRHSILAEAVTDPRENYSVKLEGAVITINASRLGLLCAIDRLQFLHEFISKTKQASLTAEIEHTVHLITPAKPNPAPKKQTRKLGSFFQKVGRDSKPNNRRFSWSASERAQEDEIPKKMN